MHRRLAAAASGVLIASIVAGCGGAGRSSTELRVHLFRAYAGVADYTVRCDPNGSTVKDPDGVCVALRHAPGLLRFHAAGWDHPCPGAPGVRVTGISAGRTVAVTFAPCKTGQEQWATRWMHLVGYTPRG
jgi:hypothetical protein